MSEQVKQEGSFQIKEIPTGSNEPVKTEDGVIKVTVKDDYKETQSSNEPIKVVIPDEKPEEAAETAEAEEDVVVVGETAPEPQAEGLIEVVEDEAEDVKTPDPSDQSEPAGEENKQVIEQRVLPENIDKLVAFMEETGGSVEDYVRLNTDYSSIDDKALLREYYKKTKPYLDGEDISLILEDFDYDSDLDEDRDIRKKKIAFKEEVTKAKSFLEKTKSKYYDEIKLRPGVTKEQQEALEFFNRYQKDQELAQKQHADFQSTTKNFFTNEFKGFDFKVSDKTFRYGVGDVGKVAESQSNLNNFVGKFMNEDGTIKDAKGYHKAIYLATNADKIINHFYEQGKSDATREIVNKSKNPSTAPRQTQNTEFVNGIRAKKVDSGSTTGKLKVRKFNN
jgi:hypothetical protein